MVTAWVVKMTETEQRSTEDGPHIEVTLEDDETLKIRVDEGGSKSPEPQAKANRLVVNFGGSHSAREPRRSIVTKGCLNVRKNSTVRRGSKDSDQARVRRAVRRESASANSQKADFHAPLIVPEKRGSSTNLTRDSAGRIQKINENGVRLKRRMTVPGMPTKDKIDSPRRASLHRNNARGAQKKTESEKQDDGVLGLTIEQVKAFKEVFDLFDRNGGGTIDADDLESSLRHSFKEVFDLFDRNGGGTIDADDLEGSLRSVGIELSKNEINDVIQTLDMDQSGDIDFNEFLNLMTSTERFIEMLTTSDGETQKQNYHYLLFEALTGFMKECALKDMHTIVGYYQTKYNTSKMTHVVNHYAAGERLIGLTEKQLKLHLENLKKATSHKGSKNLSPYAQPLHIVMSTTKLPVTKTTRCRRDTRHQIWQKKQTGRIRLRVRRAEQGGESHDSNVEKTTIDSPMRKSVGQEESPHEVGWVNQRTEHIEVKLPPYYLRSLTPFDELTAEDLPRIRAQVNNAIREYCLHRRHTQVHDGIQHWHSLDPELISPKSLRKNFRVVFSTYNDIDVRYLPLHT